MNAPTALLVTRSSALASALLTTKYSVLSTSPERCVDDWRELRDAPDVVIVALPEGEAGLDVVQRLRDAGCARPAVVIGVSAHEALSHAAGDVWGVPMPQAVGALVATLDAAVAAATLPTPRMEQDDASEPIAVEQARDGVDGGQSLRSVTTLALPETALLSQQERRVADVTGIWDGQRQATETPAATLTRARPAPLGDPLQYDRRATDLVRALLPLTEALPSTSGAAGVVLTLALTLAAADAGAVIISDGFEWRVAAGAGLRPLEWRLQLPESHWVIETVYRGDRILLVSDSDAVRGRLAPLPLSAHRHLLIMSLRRAPAILVLARGLAFGDEDLKRLGTMSATDLDHVADSLQVRALARALDPLRDLP
jgi:hypothetical protein